MKETRNQINRKAREHISDHEPTDDDDDVYTMYRIESEKKVKAFEVEVEICGKTVPMEIDTGATRTIINETTYRQLPDKPEMEKTQSKLSTYTGEEIPVVGIAVFSVNYDGKPYQLQAMIVQGTGPNLLGRDWLKEIKIKWNTVFKITNSCNSKLAEILKSNQVVFKEGLGKLNCTTAKIYVDPKAQPKYLKSRPVPYALKEKVEEELERLQSEGIMSPVEFSEWAAPIVPVVKPNGSVRICGDYKCTVNQASKLDNYPIPKTEDLLATLGGGNKFTKLDMSQAYQQLLLDEESKKFTTINTHKGLFLYNRLPFGISSAPGIFQRTMENLLQGIPQVVVRIDDILITGKDDQDHLKNLNTVLEKLAKAGLKLRKD